MEEKEKKRKIQPWWDLAERIGSSIVNQVVDKGLNSLEEIAKALKLDNVTVGRILAGRQNLRLSDIAKIEKDLGITIIKITEDSNIKEKELKNDLLPKLYDPEKPLSPEEKDILNKKLKCIEILSQAKTIIFP